MKLTPKVLQKIFGLTRVEAEKAEMLLLWFNAQPKKDDKWVDMEEFDRRYKWLFKKRALFYTWGPFSRGKTVVGLREAYLRGYRLANSWK